jgi:hypothetical protein
MFKQPQQPFPYPECRRQRQEEGGDEKKNDDIWIDGFPELRHHAASAHSEFEVPSRLSSNAAASPLDGGHQQQQTSCGSGSGSETKRKRRRREEGESVACDAEG